MIGGLRCRLEGHEPLRDTARERVVCERCDGVLRDYLPDKRAAEQIAEIHEEERRERRGNDGPFDPPDAFEVIPAPGADRTTIGFPRRVCVSGCPKCGGEHTHTAEIVGPEVAPGALAGEDAEHAIEAAASLYEWRCGFETIRTTYTLTEDETLTDAVKTHNHGY